MIKDIFENGTITVKMPFRHLKFLLFYVNFIVSNEPCAHSGMVCAYSIHYTWDTLTLSCFTLRAVYNDGGGCWRDT